MYSNRYRTGTIITKDIFITYLKKSTFKNKNIFLSLILSLFLRLVLVAHSITVLSGAQTSPLSCGILSLRLGGECSPLRPVNCSPVDGGGGLGACLLVHGRLVPDIMNHLKQNKSSFVF